MDREELDVKFLCHMQHNLGFRVIVLSADGTVYWQQKNHKCNALENVTSFRLSLNMGTSFDTHGHSIEDNRICMGFSTMIYDICMHKSQKLSLDSVRIT